MSWSSVVSISGGHHCPIDMINIAHIGPMVHNYLSNFIAFKEKE